MQWTTQRIGDQSGRTFVVTGPTLGGLGHHTGLELARRGARVVLAGRNPARTAATMDSIRAEVPHAEVHGVELDLADLSSVRTGAEDLLALGRLDVLVNNAGVMTPPYGRTVDGFETQMGTNHFGPFHLTGLLLPRLAEAAGADREGRRGRVVTVSSLLHRRARSVPLHDPREPLTRRYTGHREYAESKLSNLLFTFELDRRLRAAGLPVDALAAHPGMAGTHLAVHGRYGRTTGGMAGIVDVAVKSVSQSAEAGALPTLMAATEDLPSGSYCGPDGWREMRGHPHPVGASGAALNGENQRRLWELSERAVGRSWP